MQFVFPYPGLWVKGRYVVLKNLSWRVAIFFGDIVKEAEVDPPCIGISCAILVPSAEVGPVKEGPYV